MRVYLRTSRRSGVSLGVITLLLLLPLLAAIWTLWAAVVVAGALLVLAVRGVRYIRAHAD